MKEKNFKLPAKYHVYVPITKPQAAKNEVKTSSVRDQLSSVLQGSTEHFQVYYESDLGGDGATIANAILSVCERDYVTLQGYFGGITPPNLPFVILLTTDDTGASHDGCDATTLYIGASSAGEGNIDFIRSLVFAEEDEVFEAAIGLGWDCGASNGEGLSRVLANDMYPGAEPAGFMSASVWLNTEGRPDYVDTTDPTDTNYVSIGCSVLFLNWLRFQLNYTWSQIIQAGAPTLAETYTNLTSRTDGWDQFSALMEASYPEGQVYDLGTDNPFPLPNRPATNGE